MSDTIKGTVLAHRPGAIQLDYIKMVNATAVKAYGWLANGESTTGIVKLEGPDRIIDIKTLVLEMNIYESIYDPFMKMDLIIEDSLSLFTVMPIIGEEVLFVKMKTPFPEYGSIELKMVVNSIEPFDKAGTTTERFKITAVPVESIIDTGTKISKSYRDMPIHDMVNKLYEDHIKPNNNNDPTGILKRMWRNRPIDVKKTKENRTLVIPNYTPSRAMKFFAREAHALAEGNISNDASSLFVFFEDHSKFRFITVDKLIEEANLEKNVQQYFVTDKDFKQDVENSSALTNVNGKPLEFIKINSFRFRKIFNVESNLIGGMFNNVVLAIDPQNQSVEYKRFSYEDDFENFEHTASPLSGTTRQAILEQSVEQFRKENETDTGNENKEPVSRQARRPTKASKIFTKGSPWAKFGKLDPQNDKSSDSAHVRMIMTNKNHKSQYRVNPSQKEDFLHYSIAQTAMLDNIVMDLSIPGDSDRKAGDIIELMFPEYGATDDIMGNKNKYISGWFLVTAVKHSYSSKEGYSTHIECIKTCYESEITL